MRPRRSATVVANNSLRNAMGAASVPASSLPMSRLQPTTSADKMAASLRSMSSPDTGAPPDSNELVKTVYGNSEGESISAVRGHAAIRVRMSVVNGGLNGSTQHFILNEEMECMQMTRRNGRGFSSAEKTELWDRWQRGESLKAIGRVFGKPSSSIYFQLSPHGGIRPSPRRRSRLALRAIVKSCVWADHAAARSWRSPSTNLTPRMISARWFDPSSFLHFL